MTYHDILNKRGDDLKNQEETDDDMVPIQVKVKRKFRESFQDKCAKKGSNPSVWLRMQMQAFIDDDK